MCVCVCFFVWFMGLCGCLFVMVVVVNLLFFSKDNLTFELVKTKVN